MDELELADISHSLRLTLRRQALLGLRRRPRDSTVRRYVLN